MGDDTANLHTSLHGPPTPGPLAAHPYLPTPDHVQMHALIDLIGGWASGRGRMCPVYRLADLCGWSERALRLEG